MRKVFLVLLTLALAAPLYAGTITFTATDNQDGTCTISYSTTDAVPVAMALNVDVDGGLITDIAVDSFFDIYIDAAYDLGGTYTYGASTPIAEQDVAGKANLPLAAFCISMVGLGGEAEPLEVAPSSGSIILVFSGPNCTGTISANTLRTGQGGTGVIDVNGDAMTTNLPLAFTNIEEEYCYLGHGQTDEQEWIERGRPACWCYPRQCYGDVDNVEEIVEPFDQYWVWNLDVGVLVAGYGQKYNGDPATQPWICADFDHLEEFVEPFDYFRVFNDDVTIFVTWYGQYGMPTDCCPGCM